MPTLEQLEIFTHVVNSGSFSETGRRLRKAQSAISSSIANLEIALGVTLFTRTGRTPTLTQEGELLLRDAQSLIEQKERLCKRAHQLFERVDAKISIVIDDCIAENFYMDILEEFSKKFPDTELEILTESLEDTEKSVKRGRVDLGLAVPLMGVGKNLEGIRIQSSRLVSVVASNHPLAKLKNPKTSDFLKYRQLAISCRGGEKEFEDYLWGRQIWFANTCQTLRNLLLRGVGFGFIPEHIVRKDIQQKRLTILNGLQENIISSADIYLIQQPQRKFGVAGEWLISELSKEK